MPINEFKCPQCGYRTEKLFLNNNTEEEVICPVCGSKMVRVFSGSVGLVFKGSGFYVTDYKNKKGGTTKDKKQKQDK